MISAKLLNSEASLNDFIYLTSVSYVPGENLKVCFQTYNEQRQIRYIPPDTAIMSVSLIDVDEAEIIIVADNISPDDRSMWSFELTQEQTETLGSATIEFTLDVNGDGSVIYRAVLYNVLQRSNLSGDC